MSQRQGPAAIAESETVLAWLRAPTSRRNLWASLALLALITLALFYRFVFLGQALVPADILATWYPWKHYVVGSLPHNPLLSDVIDTFYTHDAFFVSQLHQGIIPLWDPTILGGHPSLANGWSAELYPPRLLLLAILPQWIALGLNLMLHVYLAGVFSLLLLRRLGVGPFGALVGAMAWMLNGYVMVWLEYGHTVATAALLPLALLVFELSVSKRRLGWSLATALVIALSLLSGSIQRGAYLLIALAFYLAYRVVVCYLAERQLRSLVWPLVSFSVAVTIGFGLAAVVLAPTLELIAYSQRSVIPLANLFPSPWLRLGLLAAFVAPGIAGGPTYPIDLYQLARTNANEFQGYAGLLTLVLAAAAVRRPRGPVLLFALGAGIALLLALGSPLYYLFYYLVPGFNKLGPQRVLILYAFGIAMLAGIGADKLAAPDGSSLARQLRRLTAWAVGVSLVALAALNIAIRLFRETILAAGREYARVHIYGTPLNPRSLDAYYDEVTRLYDSFVAHFGPASPAVYTPVLLALGCLGVLFLRERRQRLFPAACLALIAGDLLSFALAYNTAVAPAMIYPRPPAVEFLQRDSEIYRVALDTTQGNLFPNTLQPFGIQELGGYESLYPDRYSDLLATIENNSPTNEGFGNLVLPGRFDSRMIDALNVKYVIRPPGSPAPAAYYRLVYENDVSIYQNTRALPRAFVVPDCQVVADQHSALAALVNPDFRPEAVAIFEQQSEMDPPRWNPLGIYGWPGSPESGSAKERPCGQVGGPGSATIASYTPHEVVIRASASTGGWLILGDTYYPGWQATIDGRPARVRQADYMLRAVELAPGEHTVRFAYQPPSLRLGLTVSLGAAGLALLGAIGEVALRRRRVRRTPVA